MTKLISFIAMTLLLALTPAPNQQEKTYHVSLTLVQYNQIIGGLQSSDLPAKTANQLIQEITQQVQKQLQSDTIPKKK